MNINSDDSMVAGKQPQTSEQWMALAIAQAEAAAHQNEVPVGAVIVMDDRLIGKGFNQTISQCDPSAHAEIQALRDAARHLGNHRLPGATMFVTIEPCTMCAGALVHARLARLVFGAREPEAGAICSSARVLANAGLNHQIEVIEGVSAAVCRQMMQVFFQQRR